jgi:D-beta-D-heptose 7-phosphate kinase/D-beta-D-heptose 1-phosphate adenosyltransferase
MKTVRPSPKRIRELLSRFKGKRILVLGDLMLDHFIRGKVRRISPEAPVPVVAVSDDSHMPGGCGNVCSNLAELDASVSVFSTIGDDLAGGHLISDLEERGVDARGVILDPDRQTTKKTRVVADHQQVVRFDRETLRPLSPGSQKVLLKRLEAALPNADALIISDYGKGIVTKTAVAQALRAAHRAKLPVLVDPKVEHFLRYSGVDCMTPNLSEAWGGLGRPVQEDDAAVLELGKKIIKRLRLRSVLITRGERGMTLFEKSPSRVWHIPTEAREVFDVTGAGDTVISTMALALASKARLEEAAYIANLAAGIAVGKLGTATITLGELRRRL